MQDTLAPVKAVNIVRRDPVKVVFRGCFVDTANQAGILILPADLFYGFPADDPIGQPEIAVCLAEILQDILDSMLVAVIAAAFAVH